MLKNHKIYQAVENPIVVAMNKAPSEDLKAFKTKLRDDKGALKGAEYEKFRRYIQPKFILSRCDGGFIAWCIEYLKMDYTQFSKDPILQQTMPFLSKIGLKKRH